MYFLAGVLGAAVGAGELIARYRDSPLRAMKSIGAVSYVLLNAVAAAGALAMLRLFSVDFGETGRQHDVLQVLAGGFGAMGVLRSSLFVLRVGDQDVGIGPGGVLLQLLAAADRAVDRSRARDRAKRSGELMKDVPWDKARTALPLYCLWLLQNPDIKQSEAMAVQIAELDKADVPAKVKSVSLALALMNLIGPDVLEVAIDALRSELQAA